MSEKIVGKVGYFTITETVVGGKKKYIGDSGKLIYSKRFKKFFPNRNRILKESTNLTALKKTLQTILKKGMVKKEKVLKTLDKHLYLVIFLEKSTKVKFVKVGFTTKKIIYRRFGKEYGYEDYNVETVVRKFTSKDADKIEDKLLKTLKGDKSIKRFRPKDRKFSGYSECFDFTSLDMITKTFDKFTEK